MATLLDNLRSLNRKERFILLREALGQDTFTLDSAFRASLKRSCGVDVPPGAFVAMDYHLDWIQMALYMAENPEAEAPLPDPDQELFKANQQDVDLLVAFEGRSTTHIVLIEAKADTGWNNKQLCLKADRLCLIFGRDGTRYDFATPHFLLASPKESKRLHSDEWPPWMAPDRVAKWVKLPLPQGLMKVTRCTLQGETSELGGYLRFDELSTEG